MRVLSNVNIAGMKRFLEERFPNESIQFAPYNHVAQEFLDPNSPLYTEAPGLVLMYLDSGALFQQDGREISEFDRAIEVAEARLLEALEPVTAYLNDNPQARVLVNTLAYPMADGVHSLDRNLRFHSTMIDAFNVGLSRWKTERQTDRLVICDWAARAGRIGSSALYDERLWYVGRIPLSAQGQEELASLYARTARALSGKSKKVLVVDLDDTLWGGIIGEDKVGGIALGEDGIGKAYRDFQIQLRQLRSHGILLAIASKNNEGDVDQAFAEHPMMAVTYDDFVARKIGWGPKSESILQISQELSLGLDSFVFIDDSPMERDMVRQTLPDVVVPEFPKDLFTINSWFECVAGEYFDTLLLTEEDRQRTELYRADIERNTVSKQFANIEDFYHSLQMEMRVWIDHSEQSDRIMQLTQKTNQFNLTTRRYEASDIEGFFAASDARVYDIELLDRYGSNGIVGVIITKIKGQSAEIDTFLMSCRVIGRNAENAFFAFVVNDLRKSGVKEITAEYIPSEKNAPAQGLLDQLGFEPGEGPRTFKPRQMEYPPYIRMRTNQ